VLLSAIGISRPGFPGGPGGQRGVMMISALLVVVAIGAAVLTS
jgi:hypothetical protein